MHTAAMKPSFLHSEEVSQAAKDQAVAEQREQTLAKLKEGTPEAQVQKALQGAEKSALSKLFKSECLMEQELATSEQSQSVRDFLAEEQKRLATEIKIQAWALFQIK